MDRSSHRAEIAGAGRLSIPEELRPCSAPVRTVPPRDADELRLTRSIIASQVRDHDASTEPELPVSAIADHVNVGWLRSIGGAEEELEPSLSVQRGHAAVEVGIRLSG
jgi:hypothetical protein